jgi:hypothetical protein
VLPGTATRLLGADAYQAAGQPSRVFLSGPPSPGQPGSGPFRLDEARGPGGPWAARSLTPSSTRLPPWALLLAAFALAASCLAAALWLARRRLTRRPHASGP